MLLHSTSLNSLCIMIPLSNRFISFHVILCLASSLMGKEPHGCLDSLLFCLFPNDFSQIYLCVRSFFWPWAGSQGFACFPNGFGKFPWVKVYFLVPNLLGIVDFCLFSQWFLSNSSLCPPVFAYIPNVSGQISIDAGSNRLMLVNNP